MDIPHDIQLVLEAAYEKLAEQRGMEEGLAKGVEQGFREGRETGAAHDVARLSAFFGSDVDKAMGVLEVPKASWARIAELIAQ